MIEPTRILTSEALPPLRECEAELACLKDKIQRERGFNSPFYKDKCLRRRIAVRMRARGRFGYAEYTQLLDSDPAEYDRLLDTLTINVTKFFRNADMWSAIEQEVLPSLFDSCERRCRIWSAGCSSGEEPYSISILLRQWAEQHGREAELRRFAIEGTDIDPGCLAAAERGEYPALSLVETPPALRDRWFSSGPPYRLHEEALRNVSFRRQDLISDTPPGEYSLIVCRNVIIYFEREVQERIFQAFYDALVPGGFLVLGKVETLMGRTRSLFAPVNPRQRLFRKPA
ncbi:N/A [soil metagenome]